MIQEIKKAPPKTLKDYWAEAIPARSSTSASSSVTFEKTLLKQQSAPSISATDHPHSTQGTEKKSQAQDWIQKLIEEKSAKYNVPSSLISSIVKTESAFNPHAVSSAGAQGLMQLMPGTAHDMGVNNSFDPEQNIEGGVKYFRQMLDRFGNIEHALAAYNAGPGNVSKYNGIPPFRETQNYVQKVMKNTQNV